MADDEDTFGGAFTGLKSAAGGLKNIVTDSANALDQSLFSDPKSRAALLQIGLNMMQPMAMGQTVAGHIGQAIGSGGEVASRLAEEERKEEETRIRGQRADDQLSIAEMKLQMARDPNRLTEFQRQTLKLREKDMERADAAQGRLDRGEQRRSNAERRKEINKRFDAAVTLRDDLAGDDADPERIRLKRMTPAQIRQEIEAQVRAEEKSDEVPEPTTTTAPNERQQALEWARANPNDPRAKKILERLGAQ